MSAAGGGASASASDGQNKDEDGVSMTPAAAVTPSEISEAWKNTKIYAEEFESVAQEEELREKRRRKRRVVNVGAKKNKYASALPKGVDEIMGRANTHFMRKEHEEALELLSEVVRQCPGAADPWHTMGLIHEEKGNMAKAALCLFNAAQNTKSDADLLKYAAKICVDNGLMTQASSLYSRVCRMHPGDIPSHFNKAYLHVEMKQWKRAEATLLHIYNGKDKTLEAAKRLGAVYVKTKDIERAMVIWQESLMAFWRSAAPFMAAVASEQGFERFGTDAAEEAEDGVMTDQQQMAREKARESLGHDISILEEFLVHKYNQQRYSDVVKYLDVCEAVHRGATPAGTAFVIPLQLLVLYGLSQYRCGNTSKGFVALTALYRATAEQAGGEEELGNLFKLAVDTFLQLEMHARAAFALERLVAFPKFDSEWAWSHQAIANMEIGKFDRAAERLDFLVKQFRSLKPCTKRSVKVTITKLTDAVLTMVHRGESSSSVAALHGQVNSMLGTLQMKKLPQFGSGETSLKHTADVLGNPRKRPRAEKKKTRLPDPPKKSKTAAKAEQMSLRTWFLSLINSDEIGQEDPTDILFLGAPIVLRALFHTREIGRYALVSDKRINNVIADDMIRGRSDLIDTHVDPLKQEYDTGKISFVDFSRNLIRSVREKTYDPHASRFMQENSEKCSKTIDFFMATTDSYAELKHDIFSLASMWIAKVALEQKCYLLAMVLYEWVSCLSNVCDNCEEKNSARFGYMKAWVESRDDPDFYTILSCSKTLYSAARLGLRHGHVIPVFCALLHRFVDLSRTIPQFYRPICRFFMLLSKDHVRLASDETARQSLRILAFFRAAYSATSVIGVTASFEAAATAVKNDPTNSLSLFSAAVYRLVSGCSSKQRDRHNMVISALTLFQEYSRARRAEKREEGEALTRCSRMREVWYNLGRAYHYLGLYYLAQPCYIRVLLGQEDRHTVGELVKAMSTEEAAFVYKNHADKPMVREAAVNLVQIFLRSEIQLVRLIQRVFLSF